MNNKQIQEERMKGYFIQAAMEILKTEGLKSFSVRNVASQAGYSYATLYNYFKDAKELIFQCVSGFQVEAETFINGNIDTNSTGKNRVKEIAKAYIKYCLEYTGIFELFYLEQLSDISNNKEAAKQIVDFPTRLYADELKKAYPDEAENNTRRCNLSLCITGMLLFFINRMEPSSYDEFMNRVDAQIDFVLR